MAKKNTVVSEVASALGTAAARVENLKPKRSETPKHTKAKSTTSVAAATSLSEREEVELVAYLYAEARGFQGGAPEEDWLRAEQEVRQRRA